MRAADIRPTHAIALATACELGAPTRSAADADHRASRLAARRAIRALAGPRTRIAVQRRPGRAPLARVDGRESVALSLAHCDGRAVAIAACADTRVGVDLERLAAVPPEHARYFLTTRERRWATSYAPVVLWVIKEAAWKALALGDDVPLAALELDLDARGTLRGLWLRGEWRGATATLTSPWPGYLIAAVWVSEGR
jgi:4'-phosphopantetheinyl transferase EntD